MVMLLSLRVSLRVSLCLTFRHRKGLISGAMLGLYWARMFLLNTCNKLKIFSVTLGSTNNTLCFKVQLLYRKQTMRKFTNIKSPCDFYK